MVTCKFSACRGKVTKHLVRIGTHSYYSRGRLSCIGYPSQLLWKLFSELCLGGRGQKSLVVVPVSNDVNGAGENNDPGNGFMEGKVLV